MCLLINLSEDRIPSKQSRKPYKTRGTLPGFATRLQDSEVSWDRMASPAITLAPEYELFAANVASGLSQRKAAKMAGFSVDSGFKIMQFPGVRERIEELTASPDEKIRARVNAEFLILLNRVGCMDDKQYDPDQHLRILLGFARYKGWIIDRKQVDKRSLNASVRVGRDELQAALQADLERLAPGAVSTLERLGRPAMTEEIKRIAAGEVIDSQATESVTK